MSTATETIPVNPNSKILVFKIVLTLLSIFLARMELSANPSLTRMHWFDDFGYGMMFRLGVEFGLVVLVWHASSLQEFLKIRNVIFVLASIASACLADWVGDLVPDDYSLLVITVCGAVFLVLSQKFLLHCSWKAVAGAIILAPGFFYAIFCGAGKIFPAEASTKLIVNYTPYYWQLGYLLGVFGVGELFKKAPDLPLADR